MIASVLAAAFALCLVFVPMLVEARRAAANERRQFARGGVEPKGDVYAIMRIAYPAVFLAMIAEGVWRSAGAASVFVPFASWRFAGFVFFVAAKLLKWWAITSLGDAWTFRVVVCPGSPLVAAGPYRWLRHPNYVAVVAELAAVALMSDARVTGPIGTLGFGALMLRRIAVEERALASSRQI